MQTRDVNTNLKQNIELTNTANVEEVKPSIRQVLIAEDAEDMDLPTDAPVAPINIDNKSSKPLAHLDHLRDGLEGQARSAFITKVYILFSRMIEFIQYSWQSHLECVWFHSSFKPTATFRLQTGGWSSSP